MEQKTLKKEYGNKVINSNPINLKLEAKLNETSQPSPNILTFYCSRCGQPINDIAKHPTAKKCKSCRDKARQTATIRFIINLRCGDETGN